MADIYVDSTASAGSATGADWANAYLTLAAAAAADSAGDTIWVAHNHSESTASAISLSWAGTTASPTRIICANSGSGEPPATLATTAIVATTGNNAIILVNTGVVYIYGIHWDAGNSTGVSNIVVANAAGCDVIAEQCAFNINGTSSSSSIGLNNSVSGVCKLVNCTFEFSNTGQGINVVGSPNYIFGGSVISASSPTTFLKSVTNYSRFEMEGLDLSNCSSSMNIIANSAADNLTLVMRNCKLPSSWSGSLNSLTPASDSKCTAYNCSGSDINYDLIQQTPFGSLVIETTLVKSGGASDGTTSISWEMTTNADAEWSHQTLDSPEIVRWNSTVGSSVTITVDILHDSLTNLQDDEIWLEVQYLGTSGFPLSLFADDAAATYTTTAADQTTSAASWTTTGMTNPNEQKLAVTITPQEIGYFIAKVKVAKASYTIYVDPVLQIS